MAGTTEPPDQTEAATRPDRQGDTDFPSDTPPEIQPQQDPSDNPGQAPDEVTPGQGDTDQPDSSPIEAPEPPETPAAAD
jgi:hypothetical protein